MKLLYSPTSPYARKVRIVAFEKGLSDHIEVVTATPLENPPELQRANPLGKVPALILDDGQSLYDSPVICAYLDTLTPEPRLLPPVGSAHWRIRRQEALADGLLDAAVALVMERRRPEGERSALWQQRWLEAIDRGIEVLECDVADFPSHFDLGQIAVAAVLGYLEFRLGEIDWQLRAPRLNGWWQVISERDSVQLTRPV